MQKLLIYLNGLKKDERTAFAARCETTEGYLRKAISKGQSLGAELCISVERESNRQVTCEDLRSDVDWAYLRQSEPVA